MGKKEKQELIILIKTCEKMMDKEEKKPKKKALAKKPKKKFFYRKKNKELDAIYQNILNTKYDEHVKDKLLDVHKLLKKSSNSDDTIMRRQWLETALKIPFRKITLPTIRSYQQFNEDIKWKIDQSVYGMEDVKEYILDYIFQRITNPGSSNHVIGLYGPPGVGKTNFAYTIANMLNLPIIKISLGGTSDATKLIGIFTSYIGAIPGEIIRGIIRCKCLNPVIVLDEIDKVSKKHGEINEINGVITHLIDPVQNKEFVDSYVGFGVDVSGVLWIITFNDIELVDPIVRDRIMLFKISGYSRGEKIVIAQKFIIPSILRNLNLSKTSFVINDESIKYILDKIKDEPGVRELKRQFEILLARLNRYALIKYTVDEVIICYQMTISNNIIDAILFHNNRP